jgi:hypothetical protein
MRGSQVRFLPRSPNVFVLTADDRPSTGHLHAISYRALRRDPFRVDCCLGVALSRRKHGSKSRRGRQISQLPDGFVFGARDGKSRPEWHPRGIPHRSALHELVMNWKWGAAGVLKLPPLLDVSRHCQLAEKHYYKGSEVQEFEPKSPGRPPKTKQSKPRKTR